MRTFALIRHSDPSGVSGTGVVAQGVVFSDGTTVLRWMLDTRSTGVYESLADMIAIHGHGGQTEVRFLGLEAAA